MDKNHKNKNIKDSDDIKNIDENNKEEFIDSDVDDDTEIINSENEEEDEDVEEEDDEDEEDDDDDIETSSSINNCELEEKIEGVVIIKQRHDIVDTIDRLTIFEATRIIAERASHLDRGAVPYIDITGMTSSIEIAYNEYINRKIPFKLHRKINDKLEESKPIHEFELCVLNMDDVIPNY
jgi:DNA-directed RNA polymerase subunit K/omega